MFGSSVNEKKKSEFEAMLEQAGLGHCYAALKGSEGAVQLQHIMHLKKVALEGEAALAAALGEAGVASVDDQRALARLLRKQIEERGGFPSKPVPPITHDEMSEAWRAGLSDEQGALPSELHESGNATTKDEENAVFVDQAGEKWPAGMNIVNGHLAQSIRAQGMLKDGNEYGYIHLAAEIEMPKPFRKNSAMKAGLLEELKVAAKHLCEAHPSDVQRADVFDAFMIPPGSKEGRKVLDKGNYDIHIAEFDTAILVECASPEAAVRVRASEDFARLKGMVDRAARFVHCITARNTKRIDEVSKESDGVFLFNYFFAADIEAKGSEGIKILQSVWEYTAGWWTANANLNNSTPMLPLEGERSQYNWINHCRWERGLDIFPHLIFRPSLEQFVLKNFTANDIMAMPVLYHLA